jgi:hypothetical protein
VLLLHLLLNDARHASLAMRKHMTDYVLSYTARQDVSRPSDAELRAACASLDPKALPAFDPPTTHDNDVVRFINDSVLNAIPQNMEIRLVAYCGEDGAMRLGYRHW